MKLKLLIIYKYNMLPHATSHYTNTTTPKQSMENHRKKSTSGDTFSFPSTPAEDQDSDFEFGCFTPDSASSTDPCKDSPADHLFLNGRLLPHAFPFQPSNYANNNINIVVDSSRKTSRTSSISSKDSLMSSRSNSTNSRSSSCSASSSARTSSSDNSERKLVYQTKTMAFMGRSDRYKAGGQVYGSSQRWQFITPVPAAALSRDTSRKKVVEQIPGKEKSNKGKKQGRRRQAKTVVVRRRFGRRFFRWLVSACRKCHAMEPSKKTTHEHDHHVKADGINVKLQ